LYKLGKSNIVLDTLSRLTSNTTAVPIELELDFTFANITSMYNYTATIAEIADKFRQKLLNSYTIDLVYVYILETIKSNNVLGEDIVFLLFVL
jgi:hypothetical protein